jgi:class 3 adenylate cyclase/tetratricopeptide (TPR) repeat protein
LAIGNAEHAERSQRPSVDLEPFVSELALAWQREFPESTDREIAGTVVFADISGFTRLTERLAAKGRFGAEEMSDHLDRVLSEQLRAAYDYGGWLVKWGGDALLLMFDGADHAARACAAAAAMQSRMRSVGLLDASVGRVRLRMSIGIHTGTFSFHFLGRRHRELLITGEAATMTARLEAAAEAGEILISAATAESLPEVCRGAPKGPGILLAHPPDCGVTGGRPPATPLDVSGLMPELVLDHLVNGGGAGEHRHVAVAFLEFSGMSALRREQGAAAVAAALQHLVDVTQDACHHNVVSFHETDISPDGGKIMLVAGAPHGLENPAEAMLCALRQILEDPGALSLRAGVTAGRAFTGSVGPAFRRSYSVKGDVVNLAARIMGKTPPGQLWALSSVVEASRTQFEISDVPPFLVKGKVAPVLARSVGRPLARVGSNPDLPLIGRADELATLLAALDRARQGNGEHIDLVGDAGIGKTRLLAELTGAAQDMTVLATAAEPYRSSSPYALARPLLLDALGASDVEADALADWLIRWCREHAPELAPWLPLLSPVVGIVIPDTARTRDFAPEFRAERAQPFVLDLLRKAIQGPMLLVVDDMQFADVASAALLRHVASRAHGLPWLVVLAGRGDTYGEHPQTEGSRAIVVGPLSEAESIVFTEADTFDAPLTTHVVAAVVARGGGNPLFLRNLAATARTSNDTANLPDTIETVVAARIDRLLPVAREILRAAAVVGMSIDRELLHELLDDQWAEAAAVLEQLGEFLSSDGAELRFRQAVIRDAAYEGLAFRRRAALHGRLAELLTARSSDDPESIDAVLSLHLIEAGENEKALRAAEAAAARAAETYANTEAQVLYRRAITAAGRLASVDPTRRAQLFERLGDVQFRLGEYTSSDRSYSTACRLLRGDPLAVARVALKHARSAWRRGAYGVALRRLRRVASTLQGVAGAEAADLRVELQSDIAFTQFRRGRLAETRLSCLRVIQDGDEGRSPEVVADALAILDVVEMTLGIGVDGRRAQKALRLHEHRGDLGGQARVLSQIGYRAYFDGRWNEAVTAYSQSRELVERLGDLSNVAVANGNIAEILLDQGRLVEAEAALRDAVRVWRGSGAENDVAFGRALLGRALARQGRYDDADALLRQARDRFMEQDARIDVIDADAYQAECLLLRGQPAAALVLAESSLTAASKLSEQPVQAPLLYRVIAACHEALGRAAEADLAHDRALAAARRRGAAHEVAFTVAAMASRALRTGTTIDPALLVEARSLQRKLGLVIDLASAEESAEVASVTP